MSAQTHVDEIDIRQPLRVLLRNIWLPILGALLLGGIAFAHAESQPKVYSAKTVVQVYDPTLGSTLQREKIDPAREVGIQVLYAKSNDVVDATKRALGSDADAVTSFTVTGVSSANAVMLGAQSHKPKIAQHAAEVYASTYIAQRQTHTTGQLERQAQKLRSELTDLRSQLGALDTQIIAATPPAAPNGKAAPDTPAVRSLVEDRTAIADRVQAVSNQAAQLELEAGVRTAELAVVDHADRPTNPLLPAPKRDTAIAALLGLLLGAAIALPLDRRRDRVWTADEVVALRPGVDVIAQVPRRRRRSGAEALQLASGALQGDATAEAYRSLRANLLFGPAGRTTHVVLVTSATTTEDKTSAAVNLAISLAQGGASVALVDADVRNPSVASRFELGQTRGLVEVIRGEATVEETLRGVPVAVNLPGAVDSLHVLPAGSSSNASGETLLSVKLTDAIETLRSTHDYVVIDGTPLLTAADSLNLAWLVDGVLIFVEAGKSRRRDVNLALTQLEHVGASISGIVLRGRRRSSGYATTSSAPAPRAERPTPAHVDLVGAEAPHADDATRSGSTEHIT